MVSYLFNQGTNIIPSFDYHQLAVRDVPGSGEPEELLHAAKIDADAIVEAAREVQRSLYSNRSSSSQ